MFHKIKPNQINHPNTYNFSLQNINLGTREQGACSLWSLAGHTRPQQKKIAEQIGISNIIEMLLQKKSEKLLLVGKIWYIFVLVVIWFLGLKKSKVTFLPLCKEKQKNQFRKCFCQ